MCVTPFVARYCLSSSATNCGPLSNANESCSPCDAKTCHRTVMVLPAMVETISNTPGHLECASTMIKYDFPWKGLAKSICTLCHAFAGQDHGCKGATASISFTALHEVQPLAISSIFPSRSGNET